LSVQLDRRHSWSTDGCLRDRKGSHRLYQLVAYDGREVARFGVTDHPGDMSVGPVRRLGQRLEPVFGPKWTEKQR
jgi:hypothetical protein